MIVEEFSSLLSEICSRTSLAGERPVLWTIIANPSAGGFTIKSRWTRHKSMLVNSVLRAKEKPLKMGNSPSRTAGNSGLILTKNRGHAGEIVNNLISEAASKDADEQKPFYLIITAGGDGTSLEAMNSLYYAPCEIQQNFAILRLPMGTGNDGSDSRFLDKALDLLIDPVEIKLRRAISLKPKGGKEPFLAFNILSVGLDAFVTHMTNRMKGRLPGDSYKLWVDIAALFYDLVYKVDFMDIRSFDEAGNELGSLREKLLLLAVGESGRRSYGSQKWILPDERNVCAIKQMSVFRKLFLKELFSTGKHIHEKESLLWNASRIEFNPRHPILAQMDGETVLLDEKDYPAIIELSKPVIPVLVKKGGGLPNGEKAIK